MTRGSLQALARRALAAGPAAAPPFVFAVEERPAGGIVLRFARLRREGAILALAGSEAAEIGADAMQPVALGAVVRDPSAIAAALRRLIGATKVEEASLVLPEAWLRLVFSEATEPLPRAAAARQEVLRFKLRRLVPFRVEELRVEAVPVLALPGQEEPRRLLLAFAAEAVLTGFEEAFRAAGVRIGLVTNPSLATFAGLRRAARAPGLAALLIAHGEESTLLVAREDQPILHRHRAWSRDLDDAGRGALAVRDLKLVAAFLDEKLPGEILRETLVLAPPPLAAEWRAWLDRGLGRPVTDVQPAHLPLAVAALPERWPETVPLLGAAAMEVGGDEVVPPAPNLAHRPFVNARPVRRLAAAGAVAAALLFALNLYLYIGYSRASRDTVAQLESTRAAAGAEMERIEALEREIARLDLPRQNAQIGFLNRRIAERTFPWSELFDRLGEVLPRDVRITNLSRLSIAEDPASARARRRGGRNEVDDATPGEFPLSVHGVAKDGESLLRFVDALFGHASFGNPDLLRESSGAGGVEFDITVTYRVAPLVAAAAPGAAGGTT